MGGHRTTGIGLHYGATDESMPLVELALAAEARGFDSVFVPEHSHIPVARRTPYPGGGAVPRRYFRLWDPLTALAMVAARTGLHVGTCVALPAEHDPITYAKAVATLDRMSEGRLTLGVGFGWNDDEHDNHGHGGAAKHAVTIEKIAAMRALWTQEEASFHGDHVRLEPAFAWPKPLQRPHPPILLGGLATDRTFGRIVSWADGWIPMSMAPAVTLADDLARLRQRWVDAGRDVAGPQIVVMQAPLPAGELAEVLGTYRALGVHRVLLDIPTEGAEVLLPMLDEAATAFGGADAGVGAFGGADAGVGA